MTIGPGATPLTLRSWEEADDHRDPEEAMTKPVPMPEQPTHYLGHARVRWADGEVDDVVLELEEGHEERAVVEEDARSGVEVTIVVRGIGVPPFDVNDAEAAIVDCADPLRGDLWRTHRFAMRLMTAGPGLLW